MPAAAGAIILSKPGAVHPRGQSERQRGGWGGSPGWAGVNGEVGVDSQAGQGEVKAGVDPQAGGGRWRGWGRFLDTGEKGQGWVP